MEIYNNFNHVMIDIETLSTENNAAIIQISAVQFNPVTGETSNQFNRNITIESNRLADRDISESTLLFWFKQPKEAIDKVILNPDRVSLKSALSSFSNWLKSTTNINQVCVWGNGPSFDMVKISDAYSYFGLTKPWSYWNEKCVRTISSMLPDNKKLEEFTGIKHDGISDCLHQIKYIHKTIRKLFVLVENDSKTEHLIQNSNE